MSNDDLDSEEGLGDKEKVWAALQHFQEMRDSGQFCCLEIASDYMYVWDVQYAWSEQLPGVTTHEVRVVAGGSWPTLDQALENAYSLWRQGQLPQPNDR